MTIQQQVIKECYELAPVGSSFDETVQLTYDQRRKSRMRLQLKACDLAWFLARGQVIHQGEVLVCQDGYRVKVEAADEAVTQVETDNNLLLSRLAYHLGNRHVSLQLGEGWLRYQIDTVLDEMVVGLGGKAQHIDAPFDPEDGAYHSHGDDHSHEH